MASVHCLLINSIISLNQPHQEPHPRILKAFEDFIPWLQLESKLNALKIALSVNDADLIRSMMQELIDGYAPSDGIVDWMHLEREAEALLSAGGS